MIVFALIGIVIPGVIVDRTIRPAADPPRCADWTAIPVRSIDASHGRL